MVLRNDRQLRQDVYRVFIIYEVIIFNCPQYTHSINSRNQLIVSTKATQCYVFFSLKFSHPIIRLELLYNTAAYI